MINTLKYPVKNLLYVPTILTFLLLTSGVSIRESIQISIFIALIQFSGSQIWMMICNKENLSVYENIGMGLAIGSASSSLSQLIFRSTFFASYAWVFPTILISITKSILKSSRNVDLETEKIVEGNFYFIFLQLITIVSFSLSVSWWWLYPTSIVSAILLLIGDKINQTTITLKLVYFSTIFLTVVSTLFYCYQLKNRNSSWRIISHDQVFSESLSWSLITFGKHESPFIYGKSLNYHWLALHWSGLISIASNASSWISITRVLPILSYLGIFCLLISVSYKLGSNSSKHFGTVLVFIFASNQLGFNLQRYISSPTFQFTCIWMLATLHILLALIERFSTSKAFLFGMMLFATFGGKLMNGIIILIGSIITMNFFALKSRTINGINFVIQLISVTATTIAYFYFFKSTSASQAESLKFGFNIGSEVGIIHPDSSLFLKGLGLFIFNLSMSLPILTTSVHLIRRENSNSTKAVLIATMAIAGPLLTTFTTQDGASQLYFNLSSLVISFVLLPTLFEDMKRHVYNQKVVYFLAAGIGIISLLIWEKSEQQETLNFSVILKLISVLILPFVLLLFFVKQKFCFRLNQFPKNYFSALFASMVIFSSVSVGIFQRFQIFSSVSRDPYQIDSDPTLKYGSTDHHFVLDWLRHNTPVTDVVAINRFCIPEVSTCIMKWQLVSALSHRRVLFEGGYGNPTKLEPGDISDRYRYSIRFSENPDFESMNYLCKMGVKWFFYDSYGITKLKNWLPYADIKIDRNSVTLLKLRCSL